MKINRRTVVDKALGTAGLAACVGACFAARAVAGRGGLLGPVVAVASLLSAPISFYFGSMLLRYPAERLSTAGQIAADAARQGDALTPLWKG